MIRKAANNVLSIIGVECCSGCGMQFKKKLKENVILVEQNSICILFVMAAILTFWLDSMDTSVVLS